MPSSLPDLFSSLSGALMQDAPVFSAAAFGHLALTTLRPPRARPRPLGRKAALGLAIACTLAGLPLALGGEALAQGAPSPTRVAPMNIQPSATQAQQAAQMAQSVPTAGATAAAAAAAAATPRAVTQPPAQARPAAPPPGSAAAVAAPAIMAPAAMAIPPAPAGAPGTAIPAAYAPHNEPPATPVLATPMPIGAPDNENALQYCSSIVNAAADARFARQKEALAAMEKQIQERIAQLEAKRTEYQDWLQRREAFLKKADETLVQVMSQMRPDAAAAQLTAMSEDSAAAVLSKLSPRVASAVLNEMDPARAARLTATMVGISRRTLDGRAS